MSLSITSRVRDCLNAALQCPAVCPCLPKLVARVGVAEAAEAQLHTALTFTKYSFLAVRAVSRADGSTRVGCQLLST
jgi:hypothetical protein